MAPGRRRRWRPPRRRSVPQPSRPPGRAGRGPAPVWSGADGPRGLAPPRADASPDGVGRGHPGCRRAWPRRTTGPAVAARSHACHPAATGPRAPARPRHGQSCRTACGRSTAADHGASFGCAQDRQRDPLARLARQRVVDQDEQRLVGRDPAQRQPAHHLPHGVQTPLGPREEPREHRDVTPIHPARRDCHGRDRPPPQAVDPPGHQQPERPMAWRMKARLERHQQAHHRARYDDLGQGSLPETGHLQGLPASPVPSTDHAILLPPPKWRKSSQERMIDRQTSRMRCSDETAGHHAAGGREVGVLVAPSRREPLRHGERGSRPRSYRSRDADEAARVPQGRRDLHGGRRVGPVDARARLVDDATGATGRLATEPADRRRHRADLGLPYGGRLGARTDALVQRRLPSGPRPDGASRRPRPGCRGGTRGDLARCRPDRGTCPRIGRGRVGPRAADAAESGRPARGTLLRLLVQRRPRRGGRGRRRLLGLFRRDRPRARRAPTRGAVRGQQDPGRLGDPRRSAPVDPARGRARAGLGPDRLLGRGRRRGPARPHHRLVDADDRCCGLRGRQSSASPVAGPRPARPGLGDRGSRLDRRPAGRRRFPAPRRRRGLEFGLRLPGSRSGRGARHHRVFLPVDAGARC